MQFRKNILTNFINFYSKKIVIKVLFKTVDVPNDFLYNTEGYLFVN